MNLCCLRITSSSTSSSSSSTSESSSLSARVRQVKEIISLICCLSYHFNHNMGAEDAFSKPQFLTSSSPTTTSSSSSNNGGGGAAHHSHQQINGLTGATISDPIGPLATAPCASGDGGGRAVGASTVASASRKEAVHLETAPVTPSVQLKQLKSHFENVAAGGSKISQTSEKPSRRHGDKDSSVHGGGSASVLISEGAKSVNRIFSSIGSGVGNFHRGYLSATSNNAGGHSGGCGSCVGGCGGGGMDSIVTLISGVNPPPPPLPPESNIISASIVEILEGNSSNKVMMGTSVIEGEWHQKYAFILGLLRKPHVLLVKESLTRERDKLCNKLSAYRLERNIVRESINKYIQNG